MGMSDAPCAPCAFMGAGSRSATSVPALVPFGVPVHGGQGFELFPQGMQSGWHGGIATCQLARKELARMRRKRQHRWLQPARRCLSLKLTQQSLVSAMHAIKVTNGHCSRRPGR